MCFLNGPALPRNVTLVCSDGVWVPTQPGAVCGHVETLEQKDDIFFYYFPPQYTTWTMAVDTAQLYSYRSMIGQLPVVLNKGQNDAIASVASEEAWLGGARDELRFDLGVVWVSLPHRGEMFYTGTTRGINGSAVAPYYTNFAPLQPDESGGALVIYPAFNNRW